MGQTDFRTLKCTHLGIKRGFLVIEDLIFKNNYIKILMVFRIVGQDFLEMIWIGKQATLFLIIALSVLPLWLFKEFFLAYLTKRREKKVREGMTFLFSIEKNNKNKTKQKTHTYTDHV